MKVLLIDDHPLILAALQSVIQGLSEHVQVAAANSGGKARDFLAQGHPVDLVLLDLHLGDTDGFDLLAEFRANYPAVPVVVVSATDRTSDVIRAIDMGAMGFVPKRASNDILVDALKQVISGGVYVPSMSMSTGELGSHAGQNILREAASNAGYQSTPTPSQLGLTPRQTEVLKLLLKGQPNKMIARELSLSVETVKDHVAAVLRALNVSSRTQAVIAVSQMLQGQPPGDPTGFSAWSSTSHFSGR